MPTIIDGSASATFATPLPLGEGWTGSAVGALSGPNGSAFALRNRIINGDMRIDQRNGGAAVVLGSSQIYITDRFLSANTTGTGVITGSQSTIGGLKSFRLVATTAVTNLTEGNNIQGLQTVFEAQNVFDLNGKTITISFLVDTNWIGNLAIGIVNTSVTRSYVVDRPVVAGTNSISVSIPLESNTVNTNDNGGGLYLQIGQNNEGTLRTATTNAWVTGNFQCSTASTQWAKTTGNFINVTGVQLEEGSVATPFERRPIGLELALCQRYFEIGSQRHRVDPFPANSLGANAFFAVSKRSTPTITTVSYGTLTLVTADGLNSIFFNYVAGASGNVGCTWTASAEL